MNFPYKPKISEDEKIIFKKITRQAIPDIQQASWQELHEYRSALLESMGNVLKHADSDKRDLNETEQTALKVGNEIVDAVKSEFQCREERNTKQPVDYSYPGGNPFWGNSQAKTSHVGAGEPVSYRSTFTKHDAKETNGLTSFGEFLTLVGNNNADPRLLRSSWGELGGAVGGFAVPTGFYETIYNTWHEEAIVPKRAMAYSLEHGNLSIPAFDDLDRSSDGLFGGMVPQWLGEGQTATPVTGKLREVALRAKKLALYTNMSIEVAADSPSLERAVSAKLTESIAFYVDYYLLRGNGAGQPKGVLNDSALITVARSGANAVVWTDIVQMYGRLYQPSLKKAVWVISPSVVPHLINMVDTGNHLIYVGNPSYTGTVAASVPNSLLGLPVLISEKLPSLGSEGDVLLADFSNYAFGTSPTILMERSNAPFWSQGLLSFRCIMRLDGCGLWSKAISPLNGDSDVSWCVALQ